MTDYQESITKNDKYLQCEFCQLLFYNESQKIIHESLHNEKNKNIFPCLYCPQVTSSKIEIVEHHRQNHEREPLPYYFCDYQGRFECSIFCQILKSATLPSPLTFGLEAIYV